MRYKWQVENKTVLNIETNTSFDVTIQNGLSEQFNKWVSEGNTPDPADPEPEPPVKEILRSDIISRLEAINKFDDAFTALSQDAKSMFKWNSMIRIRIDDPQVTGLLQAIGVNPSEILY